jgi:hypothetical protein
MMTNYALSVKHHFGTYSRKELISYWLGVECQDNVDGKMCHDIVDNVL